MNIFPRFSYLDIIPPELVESINKYVTYSYIKTEYTLGYLTIYYYCVNYGFTLNLCIEEVNKDEVYNELNILGIHYFSNGYIINTRNSLRIGLDGYDYDFNLNKTESFLILELINDCIKNISTN